MFKQSTAQDGKLSGSSIFPYHWMSATQMIQFCLLFCYATRVSRVLSSTSTILDDFFSISTPPATYRLIQLQSCPNYCSNSSSSWTIFTGTQAHWSTTVHS